MPTHAELQYQYRAEIGPLPDERHDQFLRQVLAALRQCEHFEGKTWKMYVSERDKRLLSESGKRQLEQRILAQQRELSRLRDELSRLRGQLRQAGLGIL